MHARFRLLVDAPAFWSALRADIAAAQRRVWIQTLSFEADGAGGPLAEALLQRNDVDRRILVDCFNRYFQSDRFVYSPQSLLSRSVRAETRATRQMLDLLSRAGAAVRHTNPAGALLHRLPARDHKKLIVIDDDIAYIGGINFTDHNFAWRDVMLRVRDRAVTEHIAADLHATWTGKKQCTRAHFDEMTIYCADGRSNPALLAELLDQIAAARESIEVMSPYLTFPFCDAMRAARRRGARVTVISPAANNRGFLRRYMLAEAARSGFDLRLYTPRMSHLKAMLIDNRTLLLGSSNFDFMTWNHLGEIVAVITNTELIEDFRARVLLPDLSDSVPVPQRALTGAWTERLPELHVRLYAGAAQVLCGERGPAGVRDREKAPKSGEELA